MFSKNTYKANDLQKDSGSHKKKALEDLAAETLRQVIDNMDGHVEMENISDFEKKQFNEKIYKILNELLAENSLHLSQGEKQKVIEYVSNEMFGFGPINTLIHDQNVTEIMVNGNNKVYVENNGKIHKTDVTFRDDDHVLHIINKIINPLGRRIDESSPTVDARLPDGSRVNAIIPPLSINGPSLTIRKFSADPFQTEDLINFGSITPDMVEFLEACVKARLNVIVSGGTGSGKTTTLNVLSSFIPEEERIVTIEDTAELQLRQDHVVTLESRPANIEGRGEYTIRELVRNCLRMRPDRIVVGEVRGGETLDMLQAMNTGHDGSISTLHANSPRDALVRLETMVLMAGMELPLRAIREQIASAVHIIVQQARMSDGSRKIIKITELVGMEGDNIKTQDIFTYDHQGTNQEGKVQGKHKATGIIPLCLEKILLRGDDFSIDSIPEWAEQQNHLNKSQQDTTEQENSREDNLEKTVSEQDEDSLSPVNHEKDAKETVISTADLDSKDKIKEINIPNIEVSCNGPDLAETGDTVTFTITVTNKSENVDLSDCIVTCSQPNMSRNTGFLPAGEQFTYQLNYKLQSEDHPFVENKVITVTSDPDCYEVEVSDKHAIAVMKPQIHAACIGPGKCTVGDEINYNIIVNNTSDSVDLLDVVITDSRQNWTKIINFLPAGNTETFEVSYTVEEKDFPAFEGQISTSAVNRFGEGIQSQALYSFSVENAPLEETEQSNKEDFEAKDFMVTGLQIFSLPDTVQETDYDDEVSTASQTENTITPQAVVGEPIITEKAAAVFAPKVIYNHFQGSDKTVHDQEVDVNCEGIFEHEEEEEIIEPVSDYEVPSVVGEITHQEIEPVHEDELNEPVPDPKVLPVREEVSTQEAPPDAEAGLKSEETQSGEGVFHNEFAPVVSDISNEEIEPVHEDELNEPVPDPKVLPVREEVSTQVTPLNAEAGLKSEETQSAEGVYHNEFAPVISDVSNEEIEPAEEEQYEQEKEHIRPVVIANKTCPDMEDTAKGVMNESSQKKEEVVCSLDNREKQAVNAENKQESTRPSIIPEGMRGLPVSISGMEYDIGCIAPGDRVDVLAIYHEERHNRELSATIIAENVLVISWLDKKRNGEGVNEIPVQIYLAVTPAQAEKLVYANLLGTLHFIVR